jgi:hypothetical protein
MVAALAPALDAAVCTEVPAAALQSHGRPGARSRSPAELATLLERAGVPAVPEPDFAAALARARDEAQRTPGAALLITGSHYALAPARAALASS